MKVANIISVKFQRRRTNHMTLYELLKQISNNITPQNDAFFRYAIYTSINQRSKLNVSD